jgi:hypothetical protein
MVGHPAPSLFKISVGTSDPHECSFRRVASRIAGVEQDALSAVFDQRSISPVFLHSGRLAEAVIEEGNLRLRSRRLSSEWLRSPRIRRGSEVLQNSKLSGTRLSFLSSTECVVTLVILRPGKLIKPPLNLRVKRPSHLMHPAAKAE